MRKAFFPILLVTSIASVGAGFSCGDSATGSGGGFGGKATTQGTMSGSGAANVGGGGSGPTFTVGSGAGGPSDDFPKDPIVDASAPKNASDLFKNATGMDTGGPCLTEPEPDSLFPDNWLRPRFAWKPAAADDNLFELTLHTSGETHDLVVYTANKTWTMDKAMWKGLASHVLDTPITMTIRGAHSDGMMLTGLATGTTAPMTIAPAGAGGAVVYWTTSNSSSLKGFQIGDETVATTLIPGQVTEKTSGGATVNCIGCHTSTPDGKYVGFTAQGPWANVLASVETATVGQTPGFMPMGGAQAALSDAANAPFGIEAYSKAHWKNGDHKMVAPLHDSPDSDLVVVDLEATDPAKAIKSLLKHGAAAPYQVGAPAWSHDGKTVVYTQGDGNGFETTGRLGAGASYTDLYAVAYNNGSGGTGKKVPGASEADVDEFYPSFSPDDVLLAFDSVPRGTNMYAQPLDELYVVRMSGGTATRLAANDPPVCSGQKSPGITNSWPKWSPSVATVGKKTYYFLVFSSSRFDGTTPQLYMTGVVDDGTKIHTYGAIYLWNQPADEHNHTPAWDIFKIPPAVPH